MGFRSDHEKHRGACRVYLGVAIDPSRKAGISIGRREGIYLYDYNENKYANMASKAINNNLGYGIPKMLMLSRTNSKTYTRCMAVSPSLS